MVTAKLAALKRALAKMRRSTIGCVLRSSKKPKLTSSARPTETVPRVIGLSQPCDGASMMA